MYLKYYRLKEYPFSLGCQERYFYQSPMHSEGLANMVYTVTQRKGMVLITGDIGTGKTLMTAVLVSRLGNRCKILRMVDPPQTAGQLYRALVEQLTGRPVAGDRLALMSQLQKDLTVMHNQGWLISVVLDEAQCLPPAVLEEIRLLWNWEEQGQKLLQIVLVGQPELRKRISQRRWAPLRQRIVLSYHLGSFGEAETSTYIDHRLKVASDGPCLAEFTPQAKRDIFLASNGVPRVINVLCDNSLLVGYANGNYRIDSPVVAEVIQNMTCWDVPAEQGASAQSPAPDEQASPAQERTVNTQEQYNTPSGEYQAQSLQAEAIHG